MRTMYSPRRIFAPARNFLLALTLASPLALAETLPFVINLADTPGTEGARLTRSYAGAGDGFAAGNQSVAVADFNADGFDDIVVGYGNYAPPGSGGSSRGRVIIEFGGESPAEQNLEEAAGNVIITNVDDNAQFGYAVAAGDINDDGRTDLVVGAPGARSGKGVVVILENSTLVNPGYSVTTDGTNPTSNETRYLGTEDSAGLGYSVACADLTDDGAAEIIAGEPRATVGGNANSGRVLVGFGPNYAAGVTMDFQMEPELYEIQGDTNMLLGSTVTTGDFNGDGRPDLLIGAPATSEPTGAAYAFFDISPGPNTADVTDSGVLSTILRLHGYAALGFALDAGDVDKDGFDDILVGMPLYSPDVDRNQAGGAALYGGRSTLAGTNINISTSVEATKITRYDGGQAIDRAGGSVALGDINADGILDIVVGQPFAKGAEDAVGNYGRIAIYSSYGKLSLGYSVIDLFSNSPDVGIFGGGATDFLGATLNLSADIDRDGYADLVTSAGFASNPGASGTGNVYTLYGDGTATSAQAVEAFGSGSTQRTGFGAPLSPVLGASIEFDGGTSSTATANITRSNASISNLGNGSLTNVAKVLWNLSTTRTLWTKAILNLDYTDAQVEGFGDSNLALYQADDPAGPWNELTGATFDTTANRVSAEVSNLGYFALLSNQPVVSLNGGNQVTLECKDEWNDPGYFATAANGDDLTDSVIVGGDTVDPTQLGVIYTITYDVEDSQGNAASTVTRTVEIIDTTKPEFTSSNFRTVEAGSVYVDTFTVEDCEDLTGQVIATGDTVDTNVLTQYTRYFDVTDSSGNVAEQYEQTITVEDNTPPVITLNGDDTIEIECGGTYTELGATVSDWDVNVGEVTINEDINTSVGGNYSVLYNVTDPSGNSAEEKVRTVKVVDTEKPVISLSFYTLEVNCGASGYGLPTVTVTDCQPGLEFSVVRGGESAVDLNTLGTYIVTYDVSDAAGNAADQVELEINVVDKLKPIITVQGSNPIQISCGDTYVDAGATATDNCGGLAGPVEVVVNNVNTNVAGFYQVNYQVSDLNGNVAGATRSVQVVGFCGTGVVEDCPAESDVSYRPLDNTIASGVAVPSEEGLDTIFEYYYSSDNPPVGSVTWWGYGMDANDLPCQRTPNSFRIAFHDALTLQTGIIPIKNAVYFEEVTPVVEDTGFVTNENIPLLRYTATLSEPFRYYNEQCCAQLFISIKGLGNPDCPFQWHVSGDDDGFHLAGPDAENATPQDAGDLAFCLEPAPETEGEGEPADSLECSSSSVYTQPVETGGSGIIVNSLDSFPAYDTFSDVGKPIGGVTWWGQLTDELLDEFVITFYEPGEAPGQTVKSFEVLPLRESTGSLEGGNLVYRFTASLPLPVDLASGWVSVVRAEGEPGLFRWFSSASGDGVSLTNDVILRDRAFCLAPAPPGQSADPNNDRVISLSEVLRVVQFYNAEYYGCLFGTEDGYGVEESADYCGYHSGDYNPADWQFNLSELLRLIQFYNYGGYELCPGQSEDGFCPSTL